MVKISKFIQKEVAKEMRNLASRIEADTCELTEEEAMHIMSVIAHQPMSKGEASSYLNMSRSKFDGLIRENKMPKGIKRKFWTELIWYKDELWQRIKRLTS